MKLLSDSTVGIIWWYFRSSQLVKRKYKKPIKDLPTNKCTFSGDIPTKILKHYAQIYSKKLADIFNESTKMGKFPDILKNVKVTPIYKKDDMNDKQNYGPVSTLD